MKKIILAAGCFWSVQFKLSKLEGVVETRAVYAGGEVPDASYENVCSGQSGHAEAVLVNYNAELLPTEKLLEFFFSIHDATQLNRQGPDMGEQYRSAIFYFDESQHETALRLIEKLSVLPKHKKEPIVTQLLPAPLFSNAEEYHQDYYKKKGF
ncbi:MAG: peptide-methionine (S)-S-oxide reductase [Bacteroidetes bacterium HGW-Bacteroidetes-6]|jgi:methionine-S-sulfoxide reductase|nr:MAG: peptide-methionine (S)-S-oxide reductase [Bacteroidetes bacterium HGW-Bacteroidetes-6]